jgi:RNA polymerase sigma factor (sigma-70 family)
MSTTPTLDRRSPYEQHRTYILSVLRRRCGWLAPDEHEALFHEAYAVMLEKERDGSLDTAAMRAPQVRAYLLQTALNKALDEGKRAYRKRSEPLDDDALNRADHAAITPEDLAASSLDSAQMREIVSELSDRQQTIVKLRFFFDRAPEEIQSFLGLTERSYRRELERALRTVSERYALVRDGQFCESRRSVILAYVAGIAGPNRSRDARKHLANCTGCAHWAGQLRTAAQGAAAVIPMPILGDDRHGLARAFEVVRDHASGIVSGIKQHVASAVTRVDPGAGYVTGARPGAAAAAIAGCLAVGGGATYCAVNGLPDPLRHTSHTATAAPGHHRPAAAAKAIKATVAPAAAVPAKTTTTARTKPATHHRTAAHTAAARRARRHQKAIAVEHKTAPEFGVEGSGATSSSATSAPAPAPKPAPTPGPPGEFDP